MKNLNRNVVLVAGVRTPFAKSFGSYMGVTNQQLLTFTLSQLVERLNLHDQQLGDVALGAVLKKSKNFNLARESVLGSGLSPKTPAVDLQRACGTGLEAIAMIANKISMGQIECGIAGGSDTNSDLPLVFRQSFTDTFLKIRNSKSIVQKLALISRLRPGDFLPEAPNVNEPRTGLRMGDHAELMAKQWKITREEQDKLALLSQENAENSYQNGFYSDLVAEFNGVEKDEFVRPQASIEALAKLKPAFDKTGGSLTAGNSTPLTDGAAVVLLASEEHASKMGWPVLAYIKDIQFAAVDFVQDEGLLMAPTHAVSSLLQRNNLSLQDFAHYEIHEAFSAQLLANMKGWNDENYCKEKLGLEKKLGAIPIERLNVSGGSVALGHPFAATGARIGASLAKLLNSHETSGALGLMSLCTAGGMGVAAILEKT